MKEEEFLHSRKPSHRWVCGEFWNLRRQDKQEKNKTEINIHLTATAEKRTLLPKALT